MAIKKVETKKVNAKKETKKVTVITYLSGLIEKGKHTRKQIIEMAMKKFPERSINTFSTLLSDGKNPKYNKFASLIKVDDKGILSF